MGVPCPVTLRRQQARARERARERGERGQEGGRGREGGREGGVGAGERQRERGKEREGERERTVTGTPTRRASARAQHFMCDEARVSIVVDGLRQSAASRKALLVPNGLGRTRHQRRVGAPVSGGQRQGPPRRQGPPSRFVCLQGLWRTATGVAVSLATDGCSGSGAGPSSAPGPLRARSTASGRVLRCWVAA